MTLPLSLYLHSLKFDIFYFYFKHTGIPIITVFLAAKYGETSCSSIDSFMTCKYAEKYILLQQKCIDWTGGRGGGRLLFFAHAKNVCDEFPSHVALHTLCRQAGQKFCKILLWGTTRCKHYKWVCIPYMVLHTGTCIRMIEEK